METNLDPHQLMVQATDTAHFYLGSLSKYLRDSEIKDPHGIVLAASILVCALDFATVSVCQTLNEFKEELSHLKDDPSQPHNP